MGCAISEKRAREGGGTKGAAKFALLVAVWVAVVVAVADANPRPNVIKGKIVPQPKNKAVQAPHMRHIRNACLLLMANLNKTTEIINHINRTLGFVKTGAGKDLNDIQKCKQNLPLTEQDLSLQNSTKSLKNIEDEIPRTEPKSFNNWFKSKTKMLLKTQLYSKYIFNKLSKDNVLSDSTNFNDTERCVILKGMRGLAHTLHDDIYFVLFEKHFTKKRDEHECGIGDRQNASTSSLRDCKELEKYRQALESWMKILTIFQSNAKKLSVCKKIRKIPKKSLNGNSNTVAKKSQQKGSNTVSKISGQRNVQSLNNNQRNLSSTKIGQRNVSPLKNSQKNIPKRGLKI